MLDNLMDHIAEETEKKKRANKVSFALPEKIPQPVSVSSGRGPLVTEYEVESDSDSDFDSDSDYESESDDDEYNFGTISDSDEDDYYYYSSEEEEEQEGEVVQSSVALASIKSYKKLPVIDLSHGHDLLVIFEEDNEEELPELSRSASDSESEDEVDIPNYKLSSEVNAYKITSEELFKSHGPRVMENAHRHQRHNAIYLMEHVF